MRTPTAPSFVLVIIVMCLSALSMGQGTPKAGGTRRWWYNFPSSPLRLEPSNSDASMMDLKRMPGDRILSYRLGCLSFDGVQAKVTKRLPPKEINLEGNRNFFSSTGLFRDDMRACGEKEPVLGVVEVRFADGGVWSIGTDGP